MGAFNLVGKAVKGAKKAAPFYSKADEVLDDLPRNKGLGNEFLAELVKKGAKPTELKDRGIDKALKDKPKMTKAELQKIFEQKAPPKVTEKVLTSDAPDYDDFLEEKAQEFYGDFYTFLRPAEQENIRKMFDDLPLTQYGRYKTPGGKNYREILLKLPTFDSKRLMELEADIRRSEGAYSDPMSVPSFRAKVEELQALKAEQAAIGEPYISSHYRQDPNLLAHIRVQDFTVPSKGYAVVNTRSGFRSEVFPTIEEAHAAMFKYPENMRSRLRLAPAEGKPKKVLLVDEIQSDMHQEGRKKGYGDSLKEGFKLSEQEPGFFFLNREGSSMPVAFGSKEEVMEQAKKIGAVVPGVLDAPFKKNWHELSMKRVLDYAAENGYDSVAITPGAEQAKRYDLSKQVDYIDYVREGQDKYRMAIVGKDGQGVNLPKEIFSETELKDYLGSDVAKKIVDGEGQSGGGRMTLRGPDLTVGGEGMKGFYDKILPDYLNNYGKKYGAQVRELQLSTGQEMSRGSTGTDMIPTYTPTMQSFHSMDITPQMREAIQTKGQPMYGKVAMPALEGMAAGTGAAAAGSQIFNEDNEQTVQNPVHFTENPDAMLLELMQRN